MYQAMSGLLDAMSTSHYVTFNFMDDAANATSKTFASSSPTLHRHSTFTNRARRRQRSGTEEMVAPP